MFLKLCTENDCRGGFVHNLSLYVGGGYCVLCRRTPSLPYCADAVMMNGVLRERGAEFNASPRIKPQNSAISQNQLKSLKSTTPYRVSPHKILKHIRLLSARSMIPFFSVLPWLSLRAYPFRFCHLEIITHIRSQGNTFFRFSFSVKLIKKGGRRRFIENIGKFTVDFGSRAVIPSAPF